MSRRTAAAARPARGRTVWTVEFLTSPAFLLGISVILLCCIGLIAVFSATSGNLAVSGLSVWTSVRSQATYMALAMLAGYFVRRVPNHLLAQVAVLGVLWLVVVVLLVLVLVGENEVLGATRQLLLPGGFSVQPSEFAKIVLIMIAARLLADWESRTISALFCLIGMLFALGVPLVLIFVENDLGTLLIIGAAVLLLALLAGMKARYFLVICVLGFGLLLFAITGYRVSRITAWVDPWSVYSDEGWQLAHSLYAFAIGGLFGTGIGNSAEKYKWLPEAENDFIFSVIGEEGGFVACIGVIALFVLLVVSGLRIAHQARERSLPASMLAAGLTLVIATQTLLNMGGVTQVLPLSGRPLPFISLGGSSVVTSLLMAALILSVARENETYEFERREREMRAAARENLTVIEGGVPDEAAPARRRPHATSGTPNDRRYPR